LAPGIKRILAASLCLAGLAAFARAAEPPATLSSSTLTAGSAVSRGEQGQRLNLPGKSPLVLPRLNGPGPLLWLPVKDALIYTGCTVVWRSSARLLQINTPNGAKARLILGEPYLFEALTRTALAQAPRLEGGTPALAAEDLRRVLERLVNNPPTWEPATQGELGAVYTLYRGTVPAEPDLVSPVEPQLAPSPGSMAGVAAKVLSGGKLKTIVIDAGHGGKDSGALGHGGLREKDTCLDIALRARAELKRLAPDLTVVLTRDRDEFLSLRERTDIANKLDADLFVSIHNNASPNRKGKGTQVFFYDSATSERAAADLVARENEDVNELEVLLTDIAKGGPIRDQSIGLASRVQTDLGRTLNLSHRDLSYAPFYVLARTKMPAILIEVAFITHREEERLLASEAWRQKVAASVARGVLAYRKQVEQKP
jgi:N-acetylmuramoyl-L-alanine amidase